MCTPSSNPRNGNLLLAHCKKKYNTKFKHKNFYYNTVKFGINIILLEIFTNNSNVHQPEVI